MSTPFDRIDPSIQARLVDSLFPVWYSGSAQSVSDKIVADLRKPGWAMLQACKLLDPPAVEALLDQGADANHIQVSINDQPQSPLCTVLVGAFMVAAPDVRPRVLALVDTLLAKGADPNKILPHKHSAHESAMHHAAADPEVLQKLIKAGGRADLVSPGAGSLLDAWFVSGMSSRAPDAVQRAIRALALLVANGLDPNSPLREQSGPVFLVRCWSNVALRRRMGDLFEMGFDPFLKGQGNEGMSFAEHLTDKIAKGRAGPYGTVVLAQLQAAELDRGLPQATAQRRLLRL